MNIKRTIISLFFLPIVVSLLAFPGRGGTGKGVVQASTNNQASNQTASDVVLAEGELEPTRYVALAFQTGGEVAEILVTEGTLVEQGAPLLRLDSTDLEVALSQAEANVAAAETNLAQAQKQLLLAQAEVATTAEQIAIATAQRDLIVAGPLPEEIAAAESTLAAAQASVSQAIGNRDSGLTISSAQIEAAEADVAAAVAERHAVEENYTTILDTCFELPDGGETCPFYGPVEETTRAQLEAMQLNEAAAQAFLDQLMAGPTAAQQRAANGAVAAAIADRDIAQAQLNLLLASATAEQTEIAEINIARAETAVTIAEVKAAEAETAVTQAENDVTSAQLEVEAIELALSRMTFTAPFTGSIARIDTKVGEVVDGGVPIIVLADFDTWQVKTTDLTEVDVARIQLDAEVSLSFEALPGETVLGTVRNISLTPGTAQGDVVYDVTIYLADTMDLPLRWGMTTAISIACSSC